MIWRNSVADLDLSGRGVIMCVLNVTPDSFSDGGRWVDADAAFVHGLEMVQAGAGIIDVGGESTRPGAEPVDEQEEMRRVLPVIERLARGLRTSSGATAALLSIDTMKPAVARAAVAAGAGIINDVTGLRDPAMREVVRTTGAAAIIMHMQGGPGDMQRAPHYEDVTREIRDFFRHQLEACLRCGLDPMCVAFDPGIGFGKTLAHNLALLRDLESLRVSERPIVVGVSRKSFIAKALGTHAAPASDRLWPTVALTSYLRIRGANVVRVHDVKANVEALRMTEAILGGAVAQGESQPGPRGEPAPTPPLHA